MLHLAGFSTASTSSTPINAIGIADPTMTVSGNLIYIGSLTNLLGAYALGGSLSSAYLQSPSLLNIAPHNITPVDSASAPSAVLPLDLQPLSPRKLITNEGLETFITNTSGQSTVLFFLSDGAISPTAGEIIHAKATATSSSTGYTWQNASMTFSTVLPAGSYDVVGMRIEGANSIAGRLVFQGSSSFRPGAISLPASDSPDIAIFRNGNLGVWGTFDQFTQPTIDIITDGTSETVKIYLDLIKH